jgi:hypothetical protein
MSLTAFRKAVFLKAGLLSVCAVLLILAPAALHAAPITYNLTLTPDAGSAYGGTGSLTIDGAPASSGLSTYTVGSSNLLGLSFLVDGQTFSLAGATGTTLVQFLNGSIYDITFSQTIGSSPNRFTLNSTGGYVFYYNDLQSASYGTFTASPATNPAPTPEPSSLLLLGTGLLGGAGSLYRRYAAKRA